MKNLRTLTGVPVAALLWGAGQSSAKITYEVSNIMKTPIERIAMNPAPPITERPRSTRLRKVVSGGSLITLLAVLITSALDVACCVGD